MPLELRPLSIPELLDRSVSLYRTHFLLFVGIMAAPAALSLLIGVPNHVVTYYSRPGSEAIASAGVIGMIGVALTYLIGTIVYFVSYVLALGATSAGVAELYQQGSPTIGSAYARIRSRAGDLVILGFLTGLKLSLVFGLLAFTGVAIGQGLGRASAAIAALFALAGFAAAFLVCAFMVLRYSLSVPVLIVEEVTATESIERSIDLTRGNLGRAFLILFCATMITYATMLVFQGPLLIGVLLAGPETLLALWLNIAGTIGGAIGSALTTPVMIIGLVVLYFDARVRKEALDVQVMMNALDQSDAATEPATSPLSG